MTMRVHHQRRKRRTAKQKLEHGKTAASRHTRKTGRTGSINARQTPPKRVTGDTEKP